MRIHAVTMEGFGAFKEKVSVDFDRFADDGMFLITGRTGAGKTTVLDAISYALYGQIPSASTGGGDKARSHYCGPADPTQVVVEFSVPEGRYRVTRSPEYQRHKSRGEGTTTEPKRANLDRLDGGVWTTLAAKEREVGQLLTPVLKVDADQFRQVILLAQGQFQEFLLASSKDRQELLRTLFGTKRFDDYYWWLKTRRDELKSELEDARKEVATIARQVSSDVPDGVVPDSGPSVGAWLSQLVADIKAELDTLQTAVTAADTEFHAARQARDQARMLAERQERRAQALAQQSTLAQEADAVEADRARLDAANRAALAWQQVRAHRLAVDKLATAAGTLEVATQSFVATVGSTPDEDLDARTKALDTAIGELSTALDAERSLTQLTWDKKAADEKVDSWQAEHEARVGVRDGLVAQIAEIETRIEAARADADLLPAAEHAEKDARTAHDAAVKAAAIEAELVDARKDAVEASERRAVASADAASLRRRQLDGQAGQLAAKLVPGQPCAVCGATEHPQPASSTDPVSDSDIAAADAVVADEDAVVRRLDHTVATLAERLESERSASAGLDVEATQQALATASTERSRLQIRKQDLQDEIVLLGDTKQQRVNAALAVDGWAATKDTVLKAQHDAAKALVDAEELIAKQRGDHASVAEHKAILDAERGATVDLRAARTAHRQAVEAETDAAQAASAALAEHGFNDADAVATARVEPSELAQMKTRVESYDTEVAATAQVLAAEDLQGLPADPVDLVPVESAFAEAQQAKETAVERRATAKGVHDQHEKAKDRVAALVEAGAEKQARFETLNQLTEAVNGAGSNELKMKLEAFVLAAELEEILSAANGRLTTMTSGRYELLHSDEKGRGASGLDVVVLDGYTGERREPRSLSGGEKFQASLALALGLADVVTARAGGITLESLFIDEGFGSLDAETLETTLATLDALREHGRTIGLISHVESMKESIPARLVVERVEGGWSTIGQQ